MPHTTKEPVRRPAQRAFLILACTLAGAAWLIHTGPMPVIRISTPLPVMAPTWYMLLAFPVLGMLVADLVDLWRWRGLDRVSAELGVAGRPAFQALAGAVGAAGGSWAGDLSYYAAPYGVSYFVASWQRSGAAA